MGSLLLRRSAGVVTLVGGAAYFKQKGCFVNVAIDGSLYTQSVLYETILMSFFSTLFNL